MTEQSTVFRDVRLCSVQAFFFLMCAFGVYKMYKINYKIVPETNFNKYLQYGTSGSE